MRIALITGASSDIGAELARLLCKHGFHVIGVARSETSLEALREELGTCFEYLAIDLAMRESISEIKNRVANYGHLDLLVSNAGYTISKPVSEHSIDDIERLFLVNAIRPIQLIIALLKYMGRGSIIVNIVTAGIYIELSSFPVYGASKRALHYASRILRRELRTRGIRVLNVYPGPVKTQFFKRAGATPRNAVDSKIVAQAIVDAVKSGASTVFIPRYLRLLSLSSVFPLPIRF